VSEVRGDGAYVVAVVLGVGIGIDSASVAGDAGGIDIAGVCDIGVVGVERAGGRGRAGGIVGVEGAHSIVMPQFGPELRFGPEPGRTGPESGSKFGMGGEPDPKSGSGFGRAPQIANVFGPGPNLKAGAAPQHSPKNEHVVSCTHPCLQVTKL